jgi:hypothetical protein
MRYRIAVAAITATAFVVGACADQDGGGSRFSTEPGGATESRYVTTGIASLLDPRTHRMRVVGAIAPNSPGVSASLSAGGVGGTLQIANGSPGIAGGAGYYRANFVDQSRHAHTVITLYSSAGGPPVAMQHYIDGTLQSTTTFSWQHTSGGWVRKGSFMRVISKNTVVATYSTTTATTTAPTRPGSPAGPAIPVRLEHLPGANALQRMIGRVAYAAAFSFAPQDASAQISGAFIVCSQEWLRFAATGASVIALTAVIADIPTVSLILASQYASALALFMAAEDALLRCVMENQPSGVFHGFGSAGGSGASGGGSDDCLEGSYAAHCTTPFTL